MVVNENSFLYTSTSFTACLPDNTQCQYPLDRFTAFILSVLFEFCLPFVSFPPCASLRYFTLKPCPGPLANCQKKKGCFTDENGVKIEKQEITYLNISKYKVFPPSGKIHINLN